MNKKLNEQYFETKKAHKKAYGKKKLTFKRIVINLLLTFLLINGYSFIQNGCEQKINKNIQENELKYDWKVSVNNSNYISSDYNIYRDSLSNKINYMKNRFFFPTRTLTLKDTLTFQRENPTFLLPKDFKIVVKEFRTKMILDTLDIKSISPKKFSIPLKEIDFWEQERLIDFYFMIDGKIIDNDLIFLRANIWDAPFFKKTDSESKFDEIISILNKKDYVVSRKLNTDEYSFDAFEENLLNRKGIQFVNTKDKSRYANLMLFEYKNVESCNLII